MTAGAVLCGGRSRRMGTDKALVPVAGVPMAARVAAALEGAGCAPVVLVGGDAAGLAALGRRWIGDHWPGEGPLGGVLSVLADLDADVVVAACDLPDLDAAAVAALLAVARRSPEADVVVAVTGRLEPMLAWWPARTRPQLERAWAGGVRAVHDAIAALRAERVTLPARALRNVNRPSDLAQPPPPGPGRAEPCAGGAGPTDVRG